MKIMKTLLLIYSILIIALSCRQPAKPQIVQFTTYTKEVDSSVSLNKMRVIYNYFFLVRNYSSKKEVISVIDSFANNFLETGKFSPNREEVRIFFYKETSNTNIESIQANPREVDRYSNEHDLVWCFTLKRNNFLKKEKIKEGEVIETNSELIDPTTKFRIKRVE
jgi:hypothetical protein